MAVGITVLIRGSAGLAEVTEAVERLLPMHFRLDIDPHDSCFRSTSDCLDTSITVYRADLEDDQGLALSRYDVIISLYWTRTTLQQAEAITLRRLMAIYLARRLVCTSGWECLALQDMQEIIPF